MTANKTYDVSLKSKVAIEAIKNIKSTAELCSEYKVPAANLYEWRDRVLSRVAELFVPESEHSKAQKALKQEIEELHRVIGELTVENNYFKKKLSR